MNFLDILKKSNKSAQVAKKRLNLLLSNYPTNNINIKIEKEFVSSIKKYLNTENYKKYSSFIVVAAVLLWQHNIAIIN